MRNEVPVSLIDHMEFYLLNYFKPGTYKKTSDTKKGQELFQQIQCTGCHKQNLTITHDRRVADVETRYDSNKGIFNDLFATATTLTNNVPGTGNPPIKEPLGNEFKVKNIFADFKRHDLGPNFWERNFDGTLTKAFMTEPLWGVGSTAPYGHDGRSINLREVILRHGGEAKESRNRFKQLSSGQQSRVLEFLQSLVLFPPDDTASNLNEGNPEDPRFPQSGHGNIALPRLFNDPTDLE